MQSTAGPVSAAYSGGNGLMGELGVQPRYDWTGEKFAASMGRQKARRLSASWDFALLPPKGLYAPGPR